MKDKIQMVMENEEEYGYAVGEEYFEVEKEVRYADGYNKGKLHTLIDLFTNNFILTKETAEQLGKITEDQYHQIIHHFNEIQTEEDLERFIK